MEDLAEAFAEKVSDECDTELSILEYAKAKKEKYRIYIGKISSDSASNKEAKRLTDLTAKISSAYSIKFSDETLMITGTSIAEVEKAIEYLYEFIEDGEFKIPCDLSKTEFTFVDTSGKITLSEKEFKSTALLASIKLGGANISDFSAKIAEYEFAFSSTENYPTLEVKTLNPLAKTEIALPEDNGGTAIITVTAEDGETEMDYEINFKYKESGEASAEVVNKDGKGGVITFVFDDGLLETADIIISKLMKKYPSIRPSFGIVTNQLANVKKQVDSYDITPLEYKYYPIKNSIFSPTKYKYEFWKQAALVEGVDVLSHSHTHSNEGINADPVFELEASQAILKELCGADSLCYVLPGAGTITNGDYMSTLEGGTVYIGARATSGAPNLVDSYNPFKVAAKFLMYIQVIFGIPTTHLQLRHHLCVNVWERLP